MSAFLYSAWRPIESAPRDGTKIDLWVEDFEVGAAGALSREDVGRFPNAFWGEEYYFYDKATIVKGQKEEWVWPDPYHPGANAKIESGGRRATFWMPAPPPPSTSFYLDPALVTVGIDPTCDITQKGDEP